MAYQGVLDDVHKAIALEKPERLPVFACSEEFDVKWYGKYTYEEMCQDGDKMAEVWIAAVEEFDYDWAWLQVDDCFEMEPLGVGTHGEENILRATTQYLPAIRETLAGLTIPDPETALSDSYQSLTFAQFGEMMQLCHKVAGAVGKRIIPNEA